MAEPIELKSIELKTISLSAFVDSDKMITEESTVSAQLSEICSSITALNEQISQLNRRKKALESNIADIEALKIIVERLKTREQEGIK